jgi:hypothetical protein
MVMNMEGFDNLDDSQRDEREDVYSKVVRAGKRTYFFDVKATKGNDYYLTITESKKRAGRDGRFFFEKHKIFLYKEDFEKFEEGLAEVINFIKEKQGDSFMQHIDSNGDSELEVQSEFAKIDFDDLEDKS